MLTTIIIGLAVGCVYALVAMGYSLIYETTRIVNFAQGAFIMIGGMSTYWLSSIVKLPYPLAVMGGVTITALAGLLLWVALVLPLWRRQTAAFVVILATLVAADLAQNVVEKLLGTNPETLPAWISGRVQFAGAQIENQYLVVIGATLVLVALVSLFLQRTAMGRCMRACAADRGTSQLLGIAPERIGALAMVVTAAIGGLAGITFAPAQYTAYSDGITYGVFGFVAAVIGGFGSLKGALAGGVAVGVIESLTGRYISTTYEEVIALAILLLLLATRPQGIMGGAWEGV